MHASRPTYHRFVALLGALLLVPLVALLGAAPAQAAPGQLTGVVSDGLGDPLAGVTVEALTALGTPTGLSATTPGDGTYTLSLPAGSYQLRYAKSGYDTGLYGDGAVIVVDLDGQASLDGEPFLDNALDPVQLVSQATYAITGTVVKAGDVPLAAIAVAIYAADDEDTPLQTTTTDAGGGYTFTQPAGTYHVQFTDPEHLFLSQWYGGASRDITVSASTPLDPTTLLPVPADAEYPIAGTVLDANGDPISGVSAAVDHVGASTDSGTGTTNATGDYSVSVLPGTYRVTFSKAGWTTAQYGDGATITVANDGVLSTNPADDLVGNRLGDQVLSSTPFAVVGTVSASGGSALAGITVRAFPSGSTDVAEIVDHTSSGAAGGYTLNLPVGTYDLDLVDDDAAAPTYLSGTLSAVKVGQGGSLSVAGTPVTSLPDVPLTVSSVDTPHPVTGGVVDTLGADVDGLAVTADPQSDGEQATTTTGADGDLGDHGRYRLMLKPGTYLVTVGGGSDWLDAPYVGDGSSPASVTVQLNGTVLVNGFEAVGGELGDTVMVGATHYPLSGTVTNGTTALSGITVTAYRDGDTSAPVEQTTTGSSGAWTLSTLVVDTYVLKFTDTRSPAQFNETWLGGSIPGTSVEVGQGGVVTRGGTPVLGHDLGEQAMSAVSVDDTYAVTGEVVDANGDGIDGLTVTATPATAGTAPTDTTGPDGDLGDTGRFRLSLKAGTYHLTVPSSTDFDGGRLTTDDETAADVLVLPGGAVTVDGEPAEGGDVGSITLVGTRQFTITGTVTDGTTGLPGITVTATPEDDSPATTTTSASNGVFTFTGTGTGAGKGLRVGTYTLDLVDNTTHATRYQATTYGGGAPIDVKIDQDGHVTVDGAPVTISVTMAAVASDTRYDLAGMVYDPNGDPLDGVTVTATPVAGTATDHLVSGTTGPDVAMDQPGGAYRLAVLPGKYQLGYAKTGYEPAKLVSWEDGSVVTVTVSPTGVITAPGLDLFDNVIDDVSMYFPAAAFATNPRLSGAIAVGRTVQTTIGTLQGASIDPDYVTVSWFLNGRPADDFSDGDLFQKFKIPAAAAGKKLSYTVSIDDPDGLRAASVYTSPAYAVPFLATVKATMKKGVLTLVLSAKGAAAPVGSIVVREGKKTVGKATLTAASKGKAVVKLTKLKKGKHKLTVVFSGGGGYGPSQTTISVTR